MLLSQRSFSRILVEQTAQERRDPSSVQHKAQAFPVHNDFECISCHITLCKLRLEELTKDNSGTLPIALYVINKLSFALTQGGLMFSASIPETMEG